MGLPNIEITFQALANSAVQRLSRGVVGVILKDQQGNGACELLRESQAAEKLPALGAENQGYIRRAFAGYVDGPKKVIAYVLPDTAADLSEALAYMETQPIDYLVGPPDIDTAGCGEIHLWVADRRAAGATPKAVLPDTAADDYAVVNFATSGICAGGKTFTAAQYCSRIAGLIAGTPIAISCTYAPLPEVTKVDALRKEDMDAAIDAGKFILCGDGARVKVARAVNSFTNATQDAALSDAFRKIKIVEAMDMVKGDIAATARGAYIGKYANSYDNKCLLITAIGNYFTQLEKEGVLQAGRSAVGLDIGEQEKYLIAHGADVAEMSAQDIKEANTGSEVFLTASLSLLDAIEDITLNITI